MALGLVAVVIVISVLMIGVGVFEMLKSVVDAGKQMGELPAEIGRGVYTQGGGMAARTLGISCGKLLPLA